MSWCWNVLRRQDRFSNPYRVLSLWWSNHLDLHRGWSQRRQFLRSQIPWNMVVPPDNNFSMSSQFVTIPRSMGYFILQHAAIALRLVTDINVRLVHTDHGAWHLGPADNQRNHSASSPAKPALHMPMPLSTTSAALPVRPCFAGMNGKKVCGQYTFP